MVVSVQTVVYWTVWAVLWIDTRALNKHIGFTFRASELHTPTLRVEAACSSETLIYLEDCMMSQPRSSIWNFSTAFILGNQEKEISQLE